MKLFIRVTYQNLILFRITQLNIFDGGNVTEAISICHLLCESVIVRVLILNHTYNSDTFKVPIISVVAVALMKSARFEKRKFLKQKSR